MDFAAEFSRAARKIPAITVGTIADGSTHVACSVGRDAPVAVVAVGNAGPRLASPLDGDAWALLDRLGR